MAVRDAVPARPQSDLAAEEETVPIEPDQGLALGVEWSAQRPRHLGEPDVPLGRLAAELCRHHGHPPNGPGRDGFAPGLTRETANRPVVRQGCAAARTASDRPWPRAADGTLLAGVPTTGWQNGGTA